MTEKKPRYFERPEQDEAPLGFWRIVLVVISTHLGVRSRQRREEDFRRANGLHIFIAGIIYFLALLVGLVVLVNSIS
ncbi:MAG: hypothetical protein ACI9WS_003505 [Paraglaciecola psychrophila]|jgi:hypothetical protein